MFTILSINYFTTLILVIDSTDNLPLMFLISFPGDLNKSIIEGNFNNSKQGCHHAFKDNVGTGNNGTAFLYNNKYLSTVITTLLTEKNIA